jgi:YbbR domain-containing protein
MRTQTVTAALAFLLATAAGGSAQDFNWRGTVDRGKSIEITGINGDIHAVAASGAEVRVSAEKSARRSNPDDVRVEVVEHDGNVTICAVYPTRSGRDTNECRPGGGGNRSTGDNDVRVDFTVEVPAGVVFIAESVNGSVEAASLQSDIKANTVNGGIEVSTSGSAEANTVNGSITATIGRADWSGELTFETVNGGIELTLPDDLNADVHASTVNGGISTDFPLTVQGRFGPKRLNGRIGNGGRTLSLTTVNGEIDLRRR